MTGSALMRKGVEVRMLPTMRSGGEVGMINREKIIKGLNYCIHTDGVECPNCPYWQDDDCVESLHTDALALLKEQETIFLKNGHHVRCMHCGEYWCYTDREGNSFPINCCPYCGRPVKQNDIW